MRTIVHILGMTPPEQHLRELLTIYPDGRQNDRSFGVWLVQGDPRVPMILACLHRLGYRQWQRQGERELSREYDLNLIREYDPGDFEQVEYAEFWPELDFAHTILGHILVQQRVRDLLLEGGFRHLVFQPTVLVSGRGVRPGRYTPMPWEQFKLSGPWWELSSDTVLPPLSPTVDLRDWRSGQPLRPADRLVRCSLREGFYNHGELHYRRSELSKLEPFDAALTFENFGPSHAPAYRTVVSKRFYDCCQRHGLRGRWAPVRIDAE
mgnify:FL=1